MITHAVGSPSRKFSSVYGEKKLLKRMCGLPMSKPDWPPSPYIVDVQFGLAVVPSHVPLSCVPPCRSDGFAGLIETLWNCSVDSPAFRVVSVVGIAFSMFVHAALLAAPRPRWLQSFVPFAEPSMRTPLERIRPPSEPSQNWSGFDGGVTIACWSGWI